MGTVKIADEGTRASVGVDPLTPVVGAVLTGVDLREPLTPDAVVEIRRALLDHHVVFVRGQDITR